MTTAAAAGPGGTLTGTGTLVRFALRRDRVRLPVWVGSIVLFLVATAASFPGLYADPASRQARAAVMGNPAAVAFGGPRIGFDDYTFGAMLTNEMLGYVALAAALMSILLVVRHTRADEEAGRTELVLASMVGRHAPVAAALAVAALANLAVVVLSALGLGSLGIESIGWAGSWLFAAAAGSVGLVFAAVAAVTAQVTEYSRGASAMAGLTLGVAYLLRAVGDIGNGVLSWLSPVGWAQRTYAYVDERWWPLLLSLALTALLILAAGALGSRRDHGAGLRAVRPGPAAGSLASPLGLALRLQRGALLGWGLSFLAFGLVYGTLLGEVEGFAAELGAVEDMLAGIGDDLADAFLSLLVSLLAMTAAIFALLATLRARGEETSGRAEPVLAAAVGRGRWLASHATVALAGSAAVMVLGAIGLGISGALTLDDGTILPAVLGASLVQLTPLLFTVAVAVALFGLAPRAAAAAWLVVAYGLGVGLLGGLLGLPQWTIRLSPFNLVPLLPADDLTFGPILILAGISAALLALGFAAFRKRDITTTA